MPHRLRNNKIHVFKALSLPIVFVCCLALSLMVFADRFLNHALNLAIKQEAQTNAEAWSRKVSDRFPALGRVTRDRDLPDDILSQIMLSAKTSSMFRFKLFSPDGTLLIVSDEPQFSREATEIGVVDLVTGVFRTGESNTTLHDGTEKPSRPDSYAEVYVQAKASDGTPFGVVEVYVDVSRLHYAFHYIFHTISHTLIIGSAIAYLIPSLFFIVRSEKIRAQERHIIHLSKVDSLTGAMNRRAFSDYCSEIFTPHRDQEFGVIFIDLDHFKQVNDGLGHEYGDALLRHIASVLKNHLAEGDVLSRYGGDEFIILTKNARENILISRCEGLLRAASQKFTFNGSTITLGVSIGAHISSVAETEEKALHRADLALYSAKARGRGQAVMFSPDLDQPLQRRRFIESTIKKALADSVGFYMDFQPIFSSQSPRSLGFEALLRLRDEEGNVISPTEFIPIAEESGLMNEIGSLALKCSLSVARSWSNDQFLAVNLSVAQFQDEDLVQLVDTLLREANFPASRLHLEVTESLLIQNEESVGRQLKGLQDLGVAISLDDFGTGYSGLGYLLKFKFDILKIDRMFLANLEETSTAQHHLIATVVSLGHKLGMDVVVEGVETESQFCLMRKFDCDQFQGFLLGAPMSAEAVGDFAAATLIERRAS